MKLNKRNCKLTRQSSMIIGHEDRLMNTVRLVSNAVRNTLLFMEILVGLPDGMCVLIILKK
jgi:hypothetical protein